MAFSRHSEADASSNTVAYPPGLMPGSAVTGQVVPPSSQAHPNAHSPSGPWEGHVREMLMSHYPSEVPHISPFDRPPMNSPHSNHQTQNGIHQAGSLVVGGPPPMPFHG